VRPNITMTLRTILIPITALVLPSCCDTPEDPSESIYWAYYPQAGAECRTCGDVFAPGTASRPFCNKTESSRADKLEDCVCHGSAQANPCTQIICEPAEFASIEILHDQALACWGYAQSQCLDTLYACTGTVMP